MHEAHHFSVFGGNNLCKKVTRNLRSIPHKPVRAVVIFKNLPKLLFDRSNVSLGFTRPDDKLSNERFEVIREVNGARDQSPVSTPPGENWYRTRRSHSFFSQVFQVSGVYGSLRINERRSGFHHRFHNGQSLNLLVQHSATFTAFFSFR
jgi:hypothetical protein